MSKKIDTFRPYTAEQIDFKDRGKGIKAPHAQAAIEEVFEHKGEAERSIKIGKSTVAIGEGSVVLGDNASAYGDGGVAVGHDAGANAPNTIAIGGDSQANAPHAISIGKDSSSSAFDSIAIGTNAQGNAASGIAVGHSAMANAEDGIALGHSAMVNRENGIALGHSAMANRENAISLGAVSEANGYASIAFGENAKANLSYSVSIGPNGQPPIKPNQGVLGGPVDNPETTYEWNIPGNLEIGGKLRVMGEFTVPTPQSDDDEDQLVTIRYLKQNPQQHQMIPSDVMILQELEEVSKDIIIFKGFRIAFPGQYRIKFETKTVSGGGRTSVSFHLNDPQGYSEYIFTVTNNDNEWKSFSRDLWFPPASLITIQLRPGNQTGTVHIRNFQVCGSLTIASPAIVPLNPPNI